MLDPQICFEDVAEGNLLKGGRPWEPLGYVDRSLDLPADTVNRKLVVAGLQASSPASSNFPYSPFYRSSPGA